MVLVVSIAWLAMAVWLISRAAGQSKLIKTLAPCSLPLGCVAPDLAVIVPARDEADNVGACLKSLLDQSYPADRRHLFLVDDHSGDATLAIARSIAESAPGLHVLRAPPLPESWTGKSHACSIGASAATATTRWFCFLDADVRAERTLLESALTFAFAEDLDVLSLAPRQELRSFAERLIIPCGLHFLGFTQDLRKRQARESLDAVATGQFMLIRAPAYKAVGGHEAVRAEICEDVALARLLKRAGYNVMMHDGTKLLSTRMYSGWATLWPGLSKNITEMMGGQGPAIGFAGLSLLLAWAAVIVPVTAGLHCAQAGGQACFAFGLATGASAALYALHIAGSIYFCIPLWYGLIFPLGYSIGAVLVFDGVRRRRLGRVSWKGRTIRLRASAGH